MFADVIAWVCRSPRRLVVTSATVLIVVLAGGSALFSSVGDGDGSASGSGGPSATPKTVAAVVPDAAPAVTAAVHFVQQWSRLKPGETTAQWQNRLVPLTTPTLMRALRTTDPANLPGATPQGDPVVRSVSQSSSLIAVPLTDGSSVVVTVVTDGAVPLVSDIQPDVGD
jgi:hypothetical protein